MYLLSPTSFHFQAVIIKHVKAIYYRSFKVMSYFHINYTFTLRHLTTLVLLVFVLICDSYHILYP